MAQLTEWLKLMVSEINRKREDDNRARDEEIKRQQETSPHGQDERAGTKA